MSRLIKSGQKSTVKNRSCQASNTRRVNSSSSTMDKSGVANSEIRICLREFSADTTVPANFGSFFFCFFYFFLLPIHFFLHSAYLVNRVIGPTSNYDAFSQAFSCKRGQSNNPIKKCSVW